METSNKPENTVTGWDKNAPHLPLRMRSWFARNMWWLTLISVVLSVLSCWAFAALFFFAAILLVGFGGGAADNAAIGEGMWTMMLLLLVFSIIELILMCWAISPLKHLKKKGWNLLLSIYLLNVVSLGLGYVIKYEMFELVWWLVFAALGGYLLLEMRGFFSVSEVAQKPVNPTVTTVK